MLLFSTMLDIRKTLDEDKFIALAIKWNQESPYEENVIKGIDWHAGEHSGYYKDEDRSLAIREYRNEKIIAIRYENKQKDGSIWDADFIMNFKSYRMSIQLDRSLSTANFRISKDFFTPDFITYLIDNNYVKRDQKLSVDYVPLVIGEDNLDKLNEIFNKGKPYTYPLVYISKTPEGKTAVDADMLAERLKGLAHVIVQQDYSTTEEIKKICGRNIEADGAIGIYYTTPEKDHSIYSYADPAETDDSIFKEIFSFILTNSNWQYVDPLFTWQGIRSALLSDKFEYQKEKFLNAEEELNKKIDEISQLKTSDQKKNEKVKQEIKDTIENELYEEFGADLEEYKEKVETLEEKNENLKRENFSLSSKMEKLKANPEESDLTPILYTPKLDWIDEDEIKDLILSILSDAKNNIPEKYRYSRRDDLLKIIIEKNDYQHIGASQYAEIKKAMQHYTGMTDKLKQNLPKLEITFINGNKYHKLLYRNDNKHEVVISCTPSRDAGSDILTDIKNMWF